MRTLIALTDDGQSHCWRREARKKILAEHDSTPARLRRYPFKPFDIRWCYLTTAVSPFQRTKPGRCLNSRFRQNAFFITPGDGRQDARRSALLLLAAWLSAITTAYRDAPDISRCFLCRAPKAGSRQRPRFIPERRRPARPDGESFRRRPRVLGRAWRQRPRRRRGRGRNDLASRPGRGVFARRT